MQISVFDESGASIITNQMLDDEFNSFEEMVKEHISKMGSMICVGDKCMVEVLYFAYHPTGERELRRKWFSVHKVGVPAHVQFYHKVMGVKTPVDMVDVIRSIKNREPDTKAYYFSTDDFTEMGITFYNLLAVNAFFSKYDKFRLHGIDYTREVIPDNFEVVVERIMG